MKEPFCQTLKISLLLSKTNIAMSEAEAIESCKIHFEITSTKIIDDALTLEITNKRKTQKIEKSTNKEIEHPITFAQISKWLTRLALSKEAHLIVGTTKKGTINWEPYFEKSQPLLQELINLNKTRDEFKISTRNASTSQGTEKNLTILELAKALEEKEFTKSNIKNPGIEFVILNISNSTQKTDKANKRTTDALVGIKLWENNNSFEKRKAHLRPVLHPTAMNPKLAMAMINLVGAENEILDPFCGAGGILLEASLSGLIATGIDIDPIMIKRAQLNLNKESNIHLFQADALTWQKKAECVVTDLPYGKSSKLKDSISKLTSDFLMHYESLTNKIAFCFPANTNFKIPKSWKIKYDFEIYIHKSLTRRILILEHPQ